MPKSAKKVKKVKTNTDFNLIDNNNEKIIGK